MPAEGKYVLDLVCDGDLCLRDRALLGARDRIRSMKISGRGRVAAVLAAERLGWEVLIGDDQTTGTALCRRCRLLPQHRGARR